MKKMKTVAWIEKRIKVLKKDEKRTNKEMKWAIKQKDTAYARSMNLLQNKLLGGIIELERVIGK